MAGQYRKDMGRTAQHKRPYSAAGHKRKDAYNTQQQYPVKRSRTSATSEAKCLLEPRPDWHAALPDAPEKNGKPIPAEDLTKAMQLLEAENAAYQQRGVTADSSRKFLSTIMTSGTFEDRISALTLVVQESPLHSMKAFENLLSLGSKKGSRNQSLMAIAALKDLAGTLLPDRKLRAFTKQSISSGTASSEHLILCAFEDWLKKKHFELVQTLEGWCNDEVPYARSRAITYVYELLKTKPEQEQNLLSLLVNKLGDTDGKIASRASYLLLQLQVSHPAMKGIVVHSIVSECLFRPGQSEHARYYAIVTLNQTVLSQSDDTVASQLLDSYYTLFLQLLGDPPPRAPPQQGGGGKPGKMAAKKAAKIRKEEERAQETGMGARDKLVSQILTGVNRALPFAAEHAVLDDKVDMLFKITHSANFNTAVQALMLLQKITSVASAGSERYYRTLYESLLDPRLHGTSKHTMYLNLVYRSLKADLDTSRRRAFIKRLIQILSFHEPPFICSVLYMVLELAGVDVAAAPEADEEERFFDAPESVDNIPRVMASAAPAVCYDPRKRDPRHAHAEMAALWDSIPLTAHFHPSVAMFAEAFLGKGVQGQTKPPKPDPATHSLLHFLDKFAYRNPKTKATAKGSSIMQPLAGSAAVDMLVKPSSTNTAVQVNSEEFWQRKIEEVAPEDVFFHSYFNRQQQSGGKKRKANKGTASQPIDSDESGAEDEIWQAIAKSRPEVEGGDEDDDLSIGDLDSAYSDDSGSDAGIDLGGDDESLDAMDDQDMLGSDDEMPDIESDDGAVFDDEDEVAIEEPEKDTSKEKGKSKNKKKFKQLPTFASADDYAKLLADEPDDV